MTRREAVLSLLAGLVLGALWVAVGPLWTVYVIGVGAILAACWRQAGELTAAQDRLAAMRERRKYEQP